MSWPPESSKAFDDPGIFVEIPLVNQIRPRVKAWREAGYPGVSSITRRLLEHWHDPEEFEARRFFFCQLEAIETLIWLTEAPAAERVGIDIPGDGGAFLRRCCKMATGSGKTIVMAMAIAWHILNKVHLPAGHPLLQERAGGCARADGEEPAGGAGSLGSRQLLRRVPHRALGTAGQAAPGAGAGAQLARAELGERGADRPQAQRGQARRR